MRHYEVVILVHPDQSEQVPAMLERYRTLVENGGGQVHRSEDWGRRQLAYPIQNLHKSHYALMNIECDPSTLEELQGTFRFNDAVLRDLIIKRDRPITDTSPLMKEKVKKDEEEKAADERRASREAASREARAAAESAAEDSGEESPAKETEESEPVAEATPADEA